MRIEGKIHAVAGLNVNEPFNDTVTISNLSIENYNPQKTRICRTFFGTTREQIKQEARALSEQWNTKNCQVSPADISSF